MFSKQSKQFSQWFSTLYPPYRFNVEVSVYIKERNTYPSSFFTRAISWPKAAICWSPFRSTCHYQHNRQQQSQNSNFHLFFPFFAILKVARMLLSKPVLFCKYINIYFALNTQAWRRRHGLVQSTLICLKGCHR